MFPELTVWGIFHRPKFDPHHLVITIWHWTVYWYLVCVYEKTTSKQKNTTLLGCCEAWLRKYASNSLANVNVGFFAHVLYRSTVCLSLLCCTGSTDIMSLLTAWWCHKAGHTPYSSLQFLPHASMACFLFVEFFLGGAVASFHGTHYGGSSCPQTCNEYSTKCWDSKHGLHNTKYLLLPFPFVLFPSSFPFSFSLPLPFLLSFLFPWERESHYVIMAGLELTM